MGLTDKGLISGSSSEGAGFYSPAGTARAMPAEADARNCPQSRNAKRGGQDGKSEGESGRH